MMLIRPGDKLEKKTNNLILEHTLVPKHEILSESEKEALLLKYSIKAKRLPKIFSSDPIIKLIDAKIGDVIKITRESPVAGEAVYYRVVIKGELK